MTPVPTLATPRTILRQWADADRDSFAEMNADPEVMAHYPATLSRAESDRMMDRLAGYLDEHGYGMWAVERRADRELLGFVGLQDIPFEAHFTPAIEVVWRLRRQFWGSGYATEAARACLEFAFTRLGAAQVVAMARPANEPSLRVMRRLGMQHSPDEGFCHPPAGQPGSLDYVLFRRAALAPG